VAKPVKPCELVAGLRIFGGHWRMLLIAIPALSGMALCV
jgi:hypothetical protein